MGRSDIALSQDNEMPLLQTMPKTKMKVPKLKALAGCLVKIFEQFFNCSVPYAFETQPAWLLSVPDRPVYDRVWTEVSAVYGALVDDSTTAFRDFLKDITPLVMPQVNPTIRISYMVTHGRIRDFTAADLEAVETYLKCHGILERMRVA